METIKSDGYRLGNKEKELSIIMKILIDVKRDITIGQFTRGRKSTPFKNVTKEN
jgi:hypothetical protein